MGKIWNGNEMVTWIFGVVVPLFLCYFLRNSKKSSTFAGFLCAPARIACATTENKE